MIENERVAEIEESQRATDNLAQVLAEQTARTIQPVDLTLREIQGRLTLPGMAQTDDQARWDAKSVFDLLADRLKSLPQVDVLALVHADGRLANHSRGFPAATLDTSKRDYFQYLSAHDDHALFVSVPVRNLYSGKWSVFLARRVNDANGAFAGVIAAAVTMSFLEDFYGAVTASSNGVTLLRRDGVLLARFPSAAAAIGSKITADSPWYPTLAAGGGRYRSSGQFGGGARLVSVHPLRDFPLVIDATTSEADVLSNWHRQALWVVVGAAAASILVVGLIRAFTFQYSRLARQNDQLETNRGQFDLVLNSMSQGLTFFDGERRLILCNRRYIEIYNLSPEHTRPGTLLADIVRQRLVKGTLPDMTIEDYLTRREAAAGPGKSFDIVDEFRNGQVISLHYEPLPGGGWVTTHEDITERRRAETGLAFMARHDPLTRLPNRTLFQERLVHALATARQFGCCALLCLDLDRFKVINDTLGHPVGDGLLRAVAARLSGAIRDGDTVARLGGDEFAIILRDLKTTEAVSVLAERILSALRKPFEIDGHRVISAASIGVAIAPKDGASADALMKKADIALYLAKTEGRGTCRFFEPEIDSYVEQRRAVEMDLRNALPAQDFELYYQPMLDLQSGEVAWFEALIRWNHPVRGMISPADFIPIAEETGLIISIGKWALRQACQEAAGWPRHVGVSVNLSPTQFKDTDLLEVVEQALSDSGLAPNRLKLEITESVLMQDSDYAISLLHQFRARGLLIALDDFGTGFSSLGYLRSFPFDKIKIDRSFIRDIDTNHGSAVIVGAIVSLAQGLGMTTIAEGVETPPQLARIRAQGCAEVQGYLFSRPRPAAEVAGLIKTLRVSRRDAEAAPVCAPSTGSSAGGAPQDGAAIEGDHQQAASWQTSDQKSRLPARA